jgi:hypothetical protein
VRQFLERRLPGTQGVVSRMRSGLVGATTIQAPEAEVVGRYPRTEVGQAAGIRLGLMFSPKLPISAGVIDRNLATGERWEAASDLHRFIVTTVINLTELQPTSLADEELLCRCCYVLGLFEQLGRIGAHPGLRLLQIPGNASIEDFLGLAPPAAIRDLSAIAAAAVEPLSVLPRSPVYVGPAFAGSGDVGGAYGDLIAGTCIVEIKSSETTRVDAAMVRQVVAYALLDYDDRYGLDEVALYLARKARLLRMSLDDGLSLMSKAPCTLGELRSELQATLAR